MNVNSENKDATPAKWHGWQVYVMAAVCLVTGVVFGYLVRGSAPHRVASARESANGATAEANPQITPQQMPQQMPSLDDMKRMADQQAAPLLAKLKSDPNDADLLNQIGNIYRVTHQFETAASYYQKSLDLNPKNVGARTDLASCMFYQGDADGAIAQLEKSLAYDPKHAGTLLNLGVVRWKGKSDAAGAIASWDKLLKYYPEYEKKPMVERLIAEAKAHTGNKLVQNR